METENGNASGGTGTQAIGSESNPFRVNSAAIQPAGTGAAPAVSPGAIEPKRKRGRPPGSKNAARDLNASKPVSIPVDAISATLFSLHAMAAAALKTPEFAIEESEAKKIAEASAKVAAHYNVVANPKTVDWCNLAVTLGMVYGTRFMALRARAKAQAKQKSQRPQAGNVAPFPGAIPGSGTLPPMDHGPGTGGVN